MPTHIEHLPGTALVTGGSRGIGAATALRLGRAGAAVGVHYRQDAAAAEQVAEGIRAAGGTAFTVQADLAERDGPATLLEAFAAAATQAVGRSELDMLVNNAAVTVAPGGLADLTAEGIDEVLVVNVRAVLLLIRDAVALMPDGGRIVNVSSGVTRVASPSTLAYGASKGAVDVMTLTLAAELGPRRIRVNAVAPGVVDTDVNAGWLRSGDDGVRQATAELAALGRIAQPDDIAAAILYMLGAGSDWVTGTVLDVSGGTRL